MSDNLRDALASRIEAWRHEGGDLSYAAQEIGDMLTEHPAGEVAPVVADGAAEAGNRWSLGWLREVVGSITGLGSEPHLTHGYDAGCPVCKGSVEEIAAAIVFHGDLGSQEHVPDEAVWVASRTYNEFIKTRPSHPDAMHAALEAALPLLGPMHRSAK